ncbi:MAG: SLBB domain-containing protein, partial [Verrucomicrobiota bacterium]
AHSFVEVPVRLPSSYLRPDPAAYRLGPGDQLTIEIADDNQTQVSTFVLPDGMLYFEAAEGINVAGLTLAEATERLSAAVRKTYDLPFVNLDTYGIPLVSMNLETVGSQTYSILGQVFNPGVYPLQGPTTILEGLAESGGLNRNELASLDRGMLVRNGKCVPVDFRSLIQRGDMGQNVYLRDGDYVFIPSNENHAVYVLGAVNEPKSLRIQDRMSLVSALASVGGLDPKAYSRKILVVRGSLAKPRIAVVDFYEITSGRQRDFLLRDGDIVWVPRSKWAKLHDYARTAIDSIATALAVNEGARSVNKSSSGGTSVGLGSGL